MPENMKVTRALVWSLCGGGGDARLGREGKVYWILGVARFSKAKSNTHRHSNISRPRSRSFVEHRCAFT